MNDDRKKPARSGGASGNKSRGAGKPFAAGDGGKPRFGKPGAGKGKPREAAAAGEERRPRKPYAPRDGDGPRQPREDGGEAKKTFQRQDGMKRAFGKSADGKPMKPRPGKWERREAAAATDDSERRPRKPYAPRDGDKPDYDKPRFAKPGEKPRFDKPRSDGPRKPRDGEAKPFRRQDGDKRAFVKRDDRDAAPRPGRRERAEEQSAEQEDGGGEERIARRLARAGVASRRDAEEMIAAGRVTLNGKVLDTPAVNVGARDRIEIDGKPIPDIERTRLFLFHKPAGVVTTSRDPEGRRTVFDVLPRGLPRLMTVGRLDINTEGLLLLTNDGGLSRVLELPATGWLRRYRVRVHGKVEESALAGLREGIAVDGVFYGAIEATLDREQGSNAWLTLALREGKNREVRNILGALGLDVTRLIRVSYGPFQLDDLKEGHVLEIKGRVLRDQLGERLVEESGANFDAEITKPFSNKPVRRTESRPLEQDRPKSTREGDRRPIGEGGLIKNRRRREDSRDEALGKLSTRPEGGFVERGSRPERGERSERGPKPGFGGKPPRGGKNSEREQRPIEPPGQRKANVWMAPGARPIGKGRAEAEKAQSDARKVRKSASYGKPAGAKPRGDRSGSNKHDGGEGGSRPRDDRPRGDHPRGPGRGGSNADRRR